MTARLPRTFHKGKWTGTTAAKGPTDKGRHTVHDTLRALLLSGKWEEDAPTPLGRADILFYLQDRGKQHLPGALDEAIRHAQGWREVVRWLEKSRRKTESTGKGLGFEWDEEGQILTLEETLLVEARRIWGLWEQKKKTLLLCAEGQNAWDMEWQLHNPKSRRR